MKKKPEPTRLMRDMHESTKDLYELGLISPRQMSDMDVLCRVAKPTVPSRAGVSKSVREALAKASRTVKRSLVPVSPHDAAALLSALSGHDTRL
jgi:hypothetical protein